MERFPPVPEIEVFQMSVGNVSSENVFSGGRFKIPDISAEALGVELDFGIFGDEKPGVRVEFRAMGRRGGFCRH